MSVYTSFCNERNQQFRSNNVKELQKTRKKGFYYIKKALRFFKWSYFLRVNLQQLPQVDIYFKHYSEQLIASEELISILSIKFDLFDHQQTVSSGYFIFSQYYAKIKVRNPCFKTLLETFIGLCAAKIRLCFVLQGCHGLGKNQDISNPI